MKKTKKNLALALAVMFGCSVTGTALAATGTENPFTTVPSSHWAYPAVTQLVKAGLIDGYKDGDFRGDNAITRYEMASLVAKAMTHVDKADAANKAAIDKLSAEYANELNNLGVRVKNLEKKVNALGKMTIGGELRIRYDYAGDGVAGFTEANADKQKNGQERFRLNMSAPLDDNWKMSARYESQAAKYGGSGSDNLNTLARAYVEGDVAGMHVLAGRGNFKTFNAYTGWDKDNWDGAGVTLRGDMTTGFRHDNAKAARMNNIKGMEVGLDYTFIKNTKFEAFYIAGKAVNGNDLAGTNNKHMAYAQMELFF